MGLFIQPIIDFGCTDYGVLYKFYGRRKTRTFRNVTLQISYVYMYAALPILTGLMIFRLIERLIKEWRQSKAAEVE